MKLRLPKAKDAVPKRKRAPIVSTAPDAPCGVCHTNLSRYTCPACNLPYCSLACFRAEQHSSCSEAFARSTLASELKGAPVEEPGPQGAGEGKPDKMMEMLRAFEEQQRELEEEEREQEREQEEDEDDTPEGIARREERAALEAKLAGVNLDALSPEDLLGLLSTSQQAAFQSTLQDPARVTQLVDEQFEGEEPWWIVEEERKMLKEMREARKAAAEKEGVQLEEEEEEESEEEDEEVRPKLVDEKRLPPLKKGPDGKALANPKLVYNVVAVLFAYAFTLRTFALTSFSSLTAQSTERIAAIQVLAQLLPFLVERSSSSVDNLEEAVEYVVARENPRRFPPPLVAILLQDLSSILRPASISSISPSDATSPSSLLSSHSLATALSALSDLYSLFMAALAASPAPPKHSRDGPVVSRPLISRPSTTQPLTKEQRMQCTLASAKLLFYASVLTAVPAVAVVCKGVAEQAEEEAEKREKEREREEAALKRRKEGMGRKKEEVFEEVKAPVKIQGPRIVEL